MSILPEALGSASRASTVQYWKTWIMCANHGSFCPDLHYTAPVIKAAVDRDGVEYVASRPRNGMECPDVWSVYA